MGPTRKSNSVNRRRINEVSPSKDADSAKRSNGRKRKSCDMLGPRWTMDELTRFYDAYRKYGKDWKKVSSAVRNRSAEMVEALYTMNRAYLSLPHGTASAAGLIAMMTDHYSNLAGSDSDQESNDGAGSSQTTQKRARGKVQPTISKATDEEVVSHSQSVRSNYGCLSLLKKKRSGGSGPCPVGKRTPRFPVSFSYENNNGERYVSPTRRGLKLKANAHDDEVAHEIAIALAEASQRGGSPQASQTPSKRAEKIMSSPFRRAQGKHSLAEMANTKLLATDMDDRYLEGSTETSELSRYKSSVMESSSIGTAREKAVKLEGKKFEVDNNSENHLDDIKEECSGTEEGQRFDATRDKLDVEDTEAKILKPSIQNQRRKSKKVLFKRDEAPAFDALQTLADLSLMMPTENEDELRAQIKDEGNDHIDESVSLEAPPKNQKKEKRLYSGVRIKGSQPISSSEIASSKISKPGKSLDFDVSLVPEENEDPHWLITKTTRKKQKILVPKVADGGKKMSKSTKRTQSGSPNLMKNSENSSNGDQQKEGSNSAQSAVQVSVVNQVNKVRSSCKMGLKRPQIQKDLKFSDKALNDQSNLLLTSLNEKAFNLKKKLSSCLSNPRLRRWCACEWFYSAIDYPWFAKREFVEYLYHVGLGHVPRLTRVEWGVIRSSLGKPRRFSEQFLKEEKEKLKQYRESVRKHYAELHEGVRVGLPTDLTKPLSVGQRVIAIHPKSRETYDGSVLTIDHSRYHIQFDSQELGDEFVMDIDCMPLNPLENIPALLGRQTIAVDKFSENFNGLQINGQAQEFMKLFVGDNVDIADGISRLSPLANSASLSKQTKVASANDNLQMRIGSAETANNQQTAYSQPSTHAQIQAKEADVQALAELNRALDKKDALVLELRHMNNDVLENQKDGDSRSKDTESFKKQYAAVLVQLNDVNAQVSSALCCLRQRNTYQGSIPLAWPMQATSLAVPAGELSSLDCSACQNQDSGSHANEIINSSKKEALAMVDAAMQALSSLKCGEDIIEKIEEAIDYVYDRVPDDSSMPASDPKSTNASHVEAQIPSELISKCIATLLMIRKCTERQFPPSDVAHILDSAVTSLQPQSSENLPVYTEIQKCVGIIRNQIMALIPT